MTNVTISLAQALCGFEMRIPLLLGEEVPIKISDVTSSVAVPRLGNSNRFRSPERRITVPGKGMPLSKSPGQRGDLIVQLHVRMPTSLTASEKQELWRILANK